MVIIKSEEKNCAQWKLGVVLDVITGRDGVVPGANLRTPKSVIERPAQHLYPLELSCDMKAAPTALNPTVSTLGLRLLPELVFNNLHKWMMKTEETGLFSFIVIFIYTIVN